MTERDIEFSRRDAGGAQAEHFVVELPGERKLTTTVLLTAGPHGVRSCGQSVGRRSDGFTAGGFAGGRGGGERGGVVTALQQGQPWRGVGWTPPREAQAGAAPKDGLR